MKTLVLETLKLYKRFISPLGYYLFGSVCRFSPTCSQYTIESVNRFGVARGLMLGTRRVLSCHPFGRSGFDPVPNKI